jgi:hypothetical protein
VVVSSHGRWARGGRDIVTESVLRADDGREVTVRQLGGSVDGIGERLFPSPALLEPGEHVSARLALARDLRGRVSRVVEAVYAPDLEAAPGAPLAAPPPFVRTITKNTKVPLYWESGCALITYDTQGTTHIPGDAEFDEMDRILANWRAATQSCSYFELRPVGRADSEVGLDGTNLILFREDSWCRPASSSDPEECYDASAAALTTVRFIDDDSSSRNGAILDADVEINAVNFAISIDGASQVNGCKSDLANTLTHELGHLMGLDHTCWVKGERLTDDQGNQVPNCIPEAALPPDITEATMFNFQDCGETKKASPEQDDIDGICAIYPIADDPQECKPANLDRGGCCAVAGARGSARGSGAGALLLAVAAGAVLRRRSRAGGAARRP